jgi:hypothetical protein
MKAQAVVFFLPFDRDRKHVLWFLNAGRAPPTCTPQGVRQIVTCDNDILDRQIDAWAVAHGHRHRPVDNSNYFSPRLNSAVLVWEFVGCQFNKRR